MCFEAVTITVLFVSGIRPVYRLDYDNYQPLKAIDKKGNIYKDKELQNMLVNNFKQ